MKRSILTCMLCLSLLLTGCSDAADTTGTQSPSVDTGELFSDRDLSGEYDDTATRVTLNGDTAACDSGAVDIDGSTVTITREGTYVLSGQLDGMVIVDVNKADKVQLVLSGASIHSETSAAVYVRQADKVFVTLAENTENALSSGERFEAIDDNNIDAVIFSKAALTLNGQGSLTIESPGGHGVVSKDELTVTGGTYSVTTAAHGLCGKDSVAIAGGTFTISAGKDGIHAENSDDESLGCLYISGGSFDISAEGDGIAASAALQLDGGDYTIVTGGGAENGEKQTSDNWGGFGGGRGGFGGMPGGDPGNSGSTSEDSTSIKGLKAGGDLTITGGSFDINAADDAIHSNTNVTVTGGNFLIATGDDGVHADQTLTIQNGAIIVKESYEGLEGLDIRICGGEIALIASDDGLNAAGGTDSSGMGGRDQFGGGMPGGMGGSSDGSIVISGGQLYVNASGDGIDANGYLEITGGYTVVVGPTQGDTATLDYDTTATITGGTFIGTGASGMAQTFSGSTGQGVIAVSVGSQSAGTSITLTDADGNVIINYTPELNFAVVILSSPDMADGESYTITVGSASGTFDAS